MIPQSVVIEPLRAGARALGPRSARKHKVHVGGSHGSTETTRSYGILRAISWRSSDARIIMSARRSRAIPLWKEKRGEAGGQWTSATTSSSSSGSLRRRSIELGMSATQERAISDIQLWVQHPGIPSFPGRDPRRLRQRPRRRVRGQVHAALVVLRRSGGGKAHSPAPAQHVGPHMPARSAALSIITGGEQMDRNDHPCTTLYTSISSSPPSAASGAASSRRTPRPTGPRTPPDRQTRPVGERWGAVRFRS